MSAEHYACLYARELPAQSLLRQQSELRNSACVVMTGEPPLQTVCSLNTKARLLGLVHGMTRVEAETFPAAIILPQSLQAESELKTILLETAGAFSPRVEERSGKTAFLCGIDIAGTESLFGSPELLGKRLLQRVRALGVSAQVTISQNLHTAIALAKGMAPRISLNVVACGDEAKVLSALPVDFLDFSPTHAETFESWGIRTLGMLADLPEAKLISRLGQEGKRLRQLARGELPHLFQPVEPAFALTERRELDFPLDDLEALLFGLAAMLDQLILRAKSRVLALASVTVDLKLDGNGTHTVSVQPALPTNDKHLWLKLLHHKLEANPPAASILAVTLHAQPGSTSKMQMGLFSPQLPDPGRLDVALARIAAIVGEGNVGCAVLEDSHAQESFHVEAFAVPTTDSQVVPGARPHTAPRQLRPRERVRVSLQNARPFTFIFQGRRYTVERAYGPWRHSGEWWNANLWGFEQWDLVARGQDCSLLCCCLLLDMMHNEWQMAALYD